MQLLIVLVMLSLIAVAFTWRQDARQQSIEDRRAKAERELAEQSAQDEALQAYLDQMSSPLLEKDLRNSREDSEVRTLARARTLTVLRRMNFSREAAVMRFLVEAKLVQSFQEAAPIVDLSYTSLSAAHPEDADPAAAPSRSPRRTQKPSAATWSAS